MLQALDRWEERLEGIFEGRPYDILDAALTDTVSKFPVHIQPFRDMIDGMRMDLVKQRYETFDELYEYCYRVAGTVGLMTTPIMGIDPSYKVCGLLLPLFAAQQTSIRMFHVHQRSAVEQGLPVLYCAFVNIAGRHLLLALLLCGYALTSTRVSVYC